MPRRKKLSRSFSSASFVKSNMEGEFKKIQETEDDHDIALIAGVDNVKYVW